VEDSGIGIKRKDYHKIFNTFQQVDQEHNRNIQGTGLGLPITLKLAEIMGGTIEFESEYGKGSVFTIYLPLVQGDPKKAVQDIHFDRISAGENVSVLVVDDNPVNLTVALGFLATHNIKAETASSGACALGMIEEKVRTGGSYDLVFMDHMMPEMDGVETVKRIREWEKANRRDKPIPVVALSANAVSGVERIFLRAGMNDFLSKPIDANQLNRVLGKWLPPEKISASAADADPEAADPAADALLEELSRIKGLDVQSGLSHVGENRESYFLALRQFCTGCDSYLEEINLFLKTEAWND
jgi:CheY-like chemotaxis protein